MRGGAMACAWKPCLRYTSAGKHLWALIYLTSPDWHHSEKTCSITYMESTSKKYSKNQQQNLVGAAFNKYNSKNRYASGIKIRSSFSPSFGQPRSWKNFAQPGADPTGIAAYSGAQPLQFIPASRYQVNQTCICYEHPPYILRSSSRSQVQFP